MTNYTRHSLESRGLPENRHFSVISEASLAIAVLASGAFDRHRIGESRL
jgi:hypothetical protein